jgi:hypothetical protein
MHICGMAPPSQPLILICCMLISQPIPGAYEGALVVGLVVGAKSCPHSCPHSCTGLHTAHKLSCIPVAKRAYLCIQISMNGTTQTIVLHSAPFLSGSSLENTLQGQDTNLRQLTIVTSSASLEPNAIPQQTFDQAFSSAHSSGYHSTVLLGLIAAALKPGAALTLREPASGGLNESAAPLKKALLLAGFVDSTDGKLMNTPQGQLVCVSVVAKLFGLQLASTCMAIVADLFCSPR